MRALTAAVVLTAFGAAGCSDAVTGTPVADPAAVSSVPTPPTTTSRAPRTIQIPIPLPTNVPDLPIPGLPSSSPGAPPPTGLAATVCGDYLTMSADQQNRVITAIGADSPLIARNPQLWVTLAAAVCSLTAKTTLVRDALVGKGFR